MHSARIEDEMMNVESNLTLRDTLGRYWALSTSVSYRDAGDKFLLGSLKLAHQPIAYLRLYGPSICPRSSWAPLALGKHSLNPMSLCETPGVLTLGCPSTRQKGQRRRLQGCLGVGRVGVIGRRWRRLRRLRRLRRDACPYDIAAADSKSSSCVPVSGVLRIGRSLFLSQESP
jgi:hypothetical protein